MTERVECLTRNRDAIAEYLDAVCGTIRPPDASQEPPPAR